jgi:predicted amidohydrolase
MVRLYLAQMETVLHNKNKNLKKMEYFVKKAAAEGANIVLFPELVLTGYFTREKTPELAESLEGESIQFMCSCASNYNIKIVFGFPEEKEGHYYNSACFINNDGKVLGSYQKTHLWDEESKYFKPGKSYPVWETDIGKIGIMICFDTDFPECSRALALNGAEIILAPTANMLPLDHLQRIYIQSRAAENQVFVATTNKVGVEEETAFFGESAAASPKGELITLGNCNESGYVVEINLEEISTSRREFNYLKERRPHTYTNLYSV